MRLLARKRTGSRSSFRRRNRRLPVEKEERTLGIFNRAVGKELKVKCIGTGEPPFLRDFLLVLDEDENIDQLKFDAAVLVGV